MKRCKKLLAVGLSVVMMISSSMMVFAEGTTSTEDAIIAQAVALDENFNLEEYEFAVVNFNGVSVNARSANTTGKAIQTIETTDNVVTQTFILPFKVLDNGDVISSFDYAESNAVNTRASVITDTMVDITITCIVDYDVVSGYGYNNYRHKGVSAYWSTSGTVSNVHEMHILYRTYGNLYNASSSGDYNIEVKSQIDVLYPEINRTYEDYVPSSERKIINTTSDLHGGWLTVDAVFYAGGSTQGYGPGVHSLY